MNETILCYDNHSNVYDLYQYSIVPEYKAALDMIEMTVGRYICPEGKIIDLGCGTGNVSAAILKKHREMKVFLIDGGKDMIEIAAKKIDSIEPDAILGYKFTDLSSDDWDGEIAHEAYDGIVSNFVLAHLPFKRYKITLQKCLSLLKPGGWFIDVEGFMERETDLSLWLREQMFENKEKFKNTEWASCIFDSRKKHEKHYLCSKSRKKSWWKQAGFSPVYTVWQYLGFALMAGRKPL